MDKNVDRNADNNMDNVVDKYKVNNMDNIVDNVKDNNKVKSKKKKFLTMMTRVVLIMAVTVYASGFVKNNLDMLWVIIGICLLTIILFFIPLTFEK